MRSRLSLKLLAALALLGTAPALAQNAPAAGGGTTSPPGTPAAPAANADVVSLDKSRWQASNLMGQKLYASTNETIGEIEDLIFTPEGGLTVVVEVGGFLGSGKKQVAVPYDQLQHSERWLLPGATKAMVEAMPEYKPG
ncbi:PRC-barrel domain-containing protein [Roseomonas marmotae]|uniref:PRC-barrel domain-containing protein n=1 Tax=Roseomonas marmotae TaxID=2768161 RepID=A0ABS3KFU2_9PROT|nr:PRC-barrel domain-containing protein [Roseomonas marmotae]MBO1076344.1 PRC-barrel domain-containing protein [Roseomonas marmotae]QTI80576.1 PRC-barrel domain-containing protein [Roseomonas marmotae]